MANKSELVISHAETAKGRGRTSISKTSEALDLTILHQSLGYHLRLLQLAYKKHFMKEATDTAFQPQHVGAMLVIGLNPGLSPSQLSHALRMDVAQVTLMLNSFELRGLITRDSSELDGRSRVIELTPAGRKAFTELRNVAVRAETSFVKDTLSPEEMRLLISLMSRLLAKEER